MAPDSAENANTGPLKGLRVLDMSRILACPAATQILGDMGADVVKVERPGHGDDTRKWGPPYLKDKNGEDSGESSYFLSCNRNKRSVAVDFTTGDGRDTLLRMIAKADILVENYRTGQLAKYGLGWDDARAVNPGLIYCSLTGFGQTGPYSDRHGYDFLVQAMGGIMSLTGPKDGEPYKTGVAISDMMAGMYMLTAMLAALHHRDKTGEGQYIDTALLDTQVAWLSNAAQYYLTSGAVTPRMGNAHPTIVPYEIFPTEDGHIALAVGNDSQFARLCDFIERPELAEDADYATNSARVENRAALISLLRDVTRRHPTAHWIDSLTERGVPCGPVNDLAGVFADPQVRARGMTVEMPHKTCEKPVKLVASPLNFSATPVSYRYAPPTLGEHTEDVLRDWLDDD